MTRKNHPFLALALGAGLAVVAPSAWAEPQHQGGNRGGQQGGGHEGAGRQNGGWHGAAQARPVEPERGPHGYQRIERPAGAEARPQQFDRPAYNHNYAADHGYHIGPYHGAPNFRYRRWGYGEFLPRYYWGRQYWLGDYWLFGLDVPPVGFEWVRYGPDALLIDTRNGEVIQVVYGRFL